MIFGLASPLLAAFLCGAAGCGGPGAARPEAATPAPSTVDRVDLMEARSRSDRRKIRSLEHELSTLKRRLVESEREAVALPPLPVEVRVPEEGEPALARETREPGPGGRAEAGEVVGVNDDGVEIVYVGEAARDQSVRPRGPVPSYVPSRRPSRSGDGSGDRSGGGAGQASSRPPTIDWQMESIANDRLPVTDRVGPKVDRLVDGAPRAAPPPAPRAAPGPRPAPRLAPRPASGPAGAPAGDPKAAYRQALDALRAGDHTTAIDGFRGLVAAYPQHDLADNAQYWLGEAFYDQRRYRDALIEFRKVVDNHSRGNKVPDALLKIGYCHTAMGEPDKARAALELVISMFPKSTPAALAAQRIETLAED